MVWYYCSIVVAADGLAVAAVAAADVDFVDFGLALLDCYCLNYLCMVCHLLLTVEPQRVVVNWLTV